MNLKSAIKSIIAFLGLGDKNPSKEILNGFQIIDPKIFVPWNIDEKRLIDLFKDRNLKQITIGYFTADCTSLKGLKCTIGFHFEPRSNGSLNMLEFFRTDCDDQIISFNEFQYKFEQTFGKPTKISRGYQGFNNYDWILSTIKISHYVIYRFGVEEHMTIKKMKK
jgi:hypothetical protein